MGFIEQRNKVSPGEIRLFLNDDEIPGIQSFSTSWSNAASTYPILGNSNVSFLPQGAQRGSFELSYDLTSSDKIIQYTGLNGVNGCILRNKKSSFNECFYSGFLTSYRTACSVGEIPKVTANFEIFNKIGNEVAINNKIVSSGNTIESYEIMKIPGPGNISFGGFDFSTNRVNSYTLSYTCNRIPTYSNGSRYPFSVDLAWPIEVDCEIGVDVDSYNFNSLNDYPLATNLLNASIQVKDFSTSQNIITYNLQNLQIVGISKRADVNSNLSASLSYKGYLTR